MLLAEDEQDLAVARPHGRSAAEWLEHDDGQVEARARLRCEWGRLIILDRGRHGIESLMSLQRGRPGLSVLDGLLAVELEAGRARTAWLVGADDLIRPWEMENISLLRGARRRVLTPVRVAGLDGGFWSRARADAALVESLVSRATRTAHWLLAKALVISAPNIKDRLLMLFTLWGERWGRVTPRGTGLKLPVTHELIANCCGARSPSITVAFQSLQKQGGITRDSRRGWLLERDAEPPGSCHCWQLHRGALGLEQPNGDGRLRP